LIRMTRNKIYCMQAVKMAVCLLVMIFFLQKAFAKPDMGVVGCSITGTNPGSRYSSYTYSLNGSLCSDAASWTVSCGSIIAGSETTTSVTVYFDNASCSSAVIQALNSSGGTIASLTVTINAAPALAGGSITNTSQVINYNSIPGPINATSAANGSCADYSYQWWSSANNSTFFAITGATTQNYQPGALTTTTYFKRTVTCGYQSATSSNIATVSVYPQVISGTINPITQTINKNSAPATLHVSPASGGNGTYSYQWQSGTSGSGPYSIIPNAVSTSYTPAALSEATYFTVITNSNGATVVSKPVLVDIYPPVVGGTITPAAAFVNEGTSPGMLTLSNVSGGNGTYTYQWQSSHYNFAAWAASDIENVGDGSSTYTPSALSSDTWYRAVVNSNGITSYSSIAKISVHKLLRAGDITPASQAIAAGQTPIQLIDDEMSGGDGEYTFRWYSSSDGSSWVRVPGGVGGSLVPQNVASTTYYKLEVTSNGETVTTNSAVIWVYPALDPGQVWPAEQPAIKYGADPISLSLYNVSGGSGSYTYQWQSSIDNTNWVDIPSAITSTYAPIGLTQTMYYRVVVNGGLTGYSSSAMVEVYPQTIESGTVADAAGLNYIRTHDVKQEGLTDKATVNQLNDPYKVNWVTQYADGLGRPIQTVSRQGSPDQKDIVSIRAYDSYDREVKKYLPYISSNSQDGNYKLNPVPWQGDFNDSYFPAERYYYKQTIYEDSPLNRVVKQGNEGLAWQPAPDANSDHSVKKSYEFNSTDEVLIIDYDSQTGNIILNTITYYAENELYLNRTVDEHNAGVIEYVDKEGHIICKKVEYGKDSNLNTLYAETYYIYDDAGNQVVVLPPEAVVAIRSSLSH